MSEGGAWTAENGVNEFKIPPLIRKAEVCVCTSVGAG